MTHNAISHRADTRRTFIKKGAVTSGALMLGLSGSGTVAAQNGGGQGLMYTNEFNGDALFRVISPVLEQNPEVDTDENIFNEYTTRRISYLNTDE